jgi:ATP-dependent Lhr-like helicase
MRYHVVNTLGWADLRPTQRDAIEPIHSGEDVLLLAPTAGGKTEAAALPILSKAATEGWRGLSVLYLCPLKALLNNLEPRLTRYAGFVGRRAAVWHGDVGDAARRRTLRDPPDVLLTTPESVEAMLVSTRVDHRAIFGDLRAVVVDELHAFAGDDRGWHLLSVLARVERLTGRPLQRVGLSATVGNPDELLAWLSRGRGGRVVGATGGVPSGEVTADYVGSVANAVKVLSRLYRGERRLVFADSRSRVEELAAGLRGAGVRTFVSHGSLSADERRQAEAAFAAEPDCVIAATSTLELGIDVGDLDRVVQVGAPPSVASFLQRMGRTGRRPGAARNCLFLATSDEELLLSLGVSRLWRDAWVERVEPAPRPAHLFAMQVMALVLQEGGVALPDVERWLAGTFETLGATDRLRVLEHMLTEGLLHSDCGVLGLGQRAEGEFGRRHFGELVVSFSSPMLLTVTLGATELGSVHPLALTPPRDGGPTVVLLAGRSWRVVDVDWPRRRVSVAAADMPGRSRWLGGARPASFSVCRAAESVLAGSEPGCALSRRAEGRLSVLRDELPFVDGVALPVVTGADGSTRIWTFAGGLANAALAYGLKGPAARPDDFGVAVRSADAGRVATAIAELDAASLRMPVSENAVRELKFGSCLPAEMAAAVMEARLSDPAGIAATLGRQRRVILSRG